MALGKHLAEKHVALEYVQSKRCFLKMKVARGEAAA